MQVVLVQRIPTVDGVHWREGKIHLGRGGGVRVEGGGGLKCRGFKFNWAISYTCVKQ